MALTRQDAAAALHDIQQTQARSANLEDYHRMLVPAFEVDR
jgi:hypothetical protein